MSKKQLKSCNNPNESSSFKKLQAKWYAKLKKDGFEDQEDERYPERPLKRHTGLFLYDHDQISLPHLISNFPGSHFREKEQFRFHPEFECLAQYLCKHGNSKITPRKLCLIWEGYCEGKTLRELETEHKISDNRILVLIRKITDWMNLMDTRPDSMESQSLATIILRDYDSGVDDPMIYSTWRNAVWYDKEDRDDQLASAFYSQITKAIKALLKYPDVRVRIACDKEDPDFIAGYSVMKGDNLEFVYVKINYRNKGIAKLLTKGFKSVAIPDTKIGAAIAYKNEYIVK